MGERSRGALPTRIAAMVGRGRERTELEALLGEARLVTLTGAGGSGKTRLALEVAADAAGRYRDGARWVDLAAVRDPRLVAGAVAAAVGVHERRRERLVATLVAHLRDCHVLLVLDNCEHLLGACSALVSEVLPASPEVTALATSRERLGLEGEVTFEVPPLSVPAPSTTSATEVLAADAVRLFELRARQVRPGFRVTDDDAAAVAEICRRLDGIPLAIELAAARVRVLTPAQIAAGLGDRFGLLTGGSRDALPRHQTLEASVAWSFDLLDDTQRLALARLSVFAGSFGLDGARGVVPGRPIEGASVLDLLTALVDRSLVQVGEHADGARYRLLETIRVYARDRLEELDDADRVRDRHLDFHLDLAARAQVGLTGSEPEAWLSRLATELDDLRAAMDWAVASRRPLAVLEIAEPTFAFWMVCGLYVEMHRRLRAAVESPAADDVARARGLTAASILTLMGGDYRAGHGFAAQAVPLARELGDEATLARALVFRSWCGFYAGEATTEAVRADSEEAIALAQELGDRETHARALMYAGTLGVTGWSFDAGRARLEEALAAIEDAGLTYMLPPTHAFLGFPTTFSGRDLDRSREHAAEALRLGRRIGQPAFVSLALAGLGMAAVLRGEERSAREHLAEALAVAQRSALPTFEMFARRALVLAEYRFGDPVRAREAAEVALRIVHETGSRWDEADVTLLLGVIALAEGESVRAEEHLRRARDASLDPRYPIPLGRSLVGLGELAHADGDADRAAELTHEGLEILADYGDHLGIVNALECLAGLAAADGQPDRALRLLGASERFHAGAGIERFPLEAGRYEQHLAAARAQLDGGEAETCWEDGSALSVDEAVRYVRRGRGERDRPRVGWRSLTPAELEVVRLVAEGCTNAEIGERLFVTVNTVKTHLSHVYAKLAVEGRTELAAEVARRDL